MISQGFEFGESIVVRFIFLIESDDLCLVYRMKDVERKKEENGSKAWCTVCVWKQNIVQGYLMFHWIVGGELFMMVAFANACRRFSNIQLMVIVGLQTNKLLIIELIREITQLSSCKIVTIFFFY